MNVVLQQLGSVPGVIGCLLCNDSGQLIDSAFPPLFDDSMLHQAAALLSDNAPAFTTPSGTIMMLDFRYGNGRIIGKPLSCGFLLLLCTSAVNIQLLSMSVNVAEKKIEKVLAGLSVSRPEVPAPATTPESPPAPPVAPMLVMPFGNFVNETPAKGKKTEKKSFWSFTLSNDQR